MSLPRVVLKVRDNLDGMYCVTAHLSYIDPRVAEVWVPRHLLWPTLIAFLTAQVNDGDVT